MQKSEKKAMDITVEEAGFSADVCNRLMGAGIKTLGDLTDKTVFFLLETCDFDKDGSDEVAQILEHNGLKLRSLNDITEEERDILYRDFLDEYDPDDYSVDSDDEWYDPDVYDDYLPPDEKSAITHEDIVEQYKERYFNEKQIKKYETFDEEKLRKVISNIKDEYLEFIYNVIIVNNVQFSMDRTQYCTSGNGTDGNYRSKIFSTLNDLDGSTFLHEMGHSAADCMVGDRTRCYDMLALRMIGKGTLPDVLKKEIAETQNQIKERVFAAHKKAVVGEIGEEAYSLLEENGDFLAEYDKLSRSIGGNGGVFITYFTSERQKTPSFQKKYAKYRQMTEIAAEKGLFAAKSKMTSCATHKQFRNDNEAILDLLSSICDIGEPFDLQMHSSTYYKTSDYHQCGELWANLFFLKVAGREQALSNIKGFLPETYAAFECIFAKAQELFAMQKEKL